MRTMKQLLAVSKNDSLGLSEARFTIHARSFAAVEAVEELLNYVLNNSQELGPSIEAVEMLCGDVCRIHDGESSHEA